MATINAYRPQPAPLMFETEEGQRMASGCIEFGGWHHRDKTLTPIQLTALLAMPGNPALFWAMDSLAAAAEAGRLDAERYIEQLREHARNIAVLRYGFQFRKTDLSEQTFRDSIDTVINRTRKRVEGANESLSAVIHGVDDAWEVCLLKFTIDLVERSSGENLGDFRKRGLI